MYLFRCRAHSFQLRDNFTHTHNYEVDVCSRYSLHVSHCLESLSTQTDKGNTNLFLHEKPFTIRGSTMMCYKVTFYLLTYFPN